ncbi:hypothetical protein HWV62_4389 [Athelia sp. TMB]|nr:hypothetical protein HWV62_4389 [Athelia sp. TMB]
MIGNIPSLKIELSALVSLELNPHNHSWDDDEIGFAEGIWSFIRTPNLEDLFLQNMPDEDLRETLWVFEEQADEGRSFEIKTLCMDHVRMQNYAIPNYDETDLGISVEDFMTSVPNVETLKLSGCSVALVLRFILEADRKNGSPDLNTLWPNLRCLVVMHPQADLLRDVVPSREAVGHPISELEIQTDLYKEGFPVDISEWIRHRVPIFSTSYVHKKDVKFDRPAAFDSRSTVAMLSY